MTNRKQSSRMSPQKSLAITLYKNIAKLATMMVPVIYYGIVAFFDHFILRPLLPGTAAAVLFWVAIVAGTPLGQSREMVRTLACVILKTLLGVISK